MGSAPADADPDLWLPKLRSRCRWWNVMLIAAPTGFVPFSVLGLFLIISEPATWLHWAELVLFAACGIGSFLPSRLQLKRIDRTIVTVQLGATCVRPSRSSYFL